MSPPGLETWWVSVACLAAYAAAVFCGGRRR